MKAEATVGKGPSSRDRIRSSCNEVAIAGLGVGGSGIGAIFPSTELAGDYTRTG